MHNIDLCYFIQSSGPARSVLLCCIYEENDLQIMQVGLRTAKYMGAVFDAQWVVCLIWVNKRPTGRFQIFESISVSLLQSENLAVEINFYLRAKRHTHQVDACLIQTVNTSLDSKIRDWFHSCRCGKWWVLRAIYTQCLWAKIRSRQTFIQLKNKKKQNQK